MPSAEFETAAKEVNNLTTTPDNNKLLELYGLFKQATVGNINTSKPTFDIKGRYKWDAWEKLKGKSQEEAEKEYIALVNSLRGKE